MFVVCIYPNIINLVYSWLSVIVPYDRFQWSIPESDQELISVEPDAGELHPNESSVRETTTIINSFTEIVQLI